MTEMTKEQAKLLKACVEGGEDGPLNFPNGMSCIDCHFVNECAVGDDAWAQKALGVANEVLAE